MWSIKTSQLFSKIKRIFKIELKSFPLIWVHWTRWRYHRRDDAWLRSRMAMVAHILDKRIDEGIAAPDLERDLHLIISEYGRRRLLVNEMFRWAWGLLLEERFGRPSQESMTCKVSEEENHNNGGGDTVSTVEKMIRGRRSVRKWDALRVPSIQDVLDMIDTAKWAPSACNRQNWHFVVLDKQDDILFCQQFARQAFYRDAPILVLVYIDPRQYAGIESHFPYLDAGAVIQNLLLLAHARGLGACWIGIASREEGLEIIAQSQERFGLDTGLLPVSMVALGYPKGTVNVPPRRPASEIVTVP